MPRPGPKKRNPTRLDALKAKEDARVLYMSGNHTLEDIADIVDTALSTVKRWSSEGEWSAQVQRLETLARKSAPQRDLGKKLAFDRAKTNKKNRDFLTKLAYKTTKAAYRNAKANVFIPIESAQDLKALVELSAKVDGSWDDSSANRFAVSLQLNTLLTNGTIQELPEGAVVEIEGD